MILPQRYASKGSVSRLPNASIGLLLMWAFCRPLIRWACPPDQSVSPETEDFCFGAIREYSSGTATVPRCVSQHGALLEGRCTGQVTGPCRLIRNLEPRPIDSGYHKRLAPVATNIATLRPNFFHTDLDSTRRRVRIICWRNSVCFSYGPVRSVDDKFSTAIISEYFPGTIDSGLLCVGQGAGAGCTSLDNSPATVTRLNMAFITAHFWTPLLQLRYQKSHLGMT